MIDVDRADLELKGECFDSAKINGKQHVNKYTAVFLGGGRFSKIRYF